MSQRDNQGRTGRRTDQWWMRVWSALRRFANAFYANESVKHFAFSKNSAFTPDEGYIDAGSLPLVSRANQQISLVLVIAVRVQRT